VRQFDLHEEKALAPLHNKINLLEDLFRVVVIPSIRNNYEGHNKHDKSKSLIKKCIDAMQDPPLIFKNPKNIFKC
jgi:hypothetical protein